MPEVTEIKQYRPEELKHVLDSGQLLAMLDVREWEERNYCAITVPERVTDLHVPIGQVPEQFKTIRQATNGQPLVVYCHHGVRSLAVARWLTEQGMSNVVNLDGGIEAWAAQVDPTIPRY